jgi:VanZ family protein
MVRKIMHWIPTFMYLALIFYLSSQSKPFNMDISFKGLDKLLHIGEYALASFLIYLSLKKSGSKRAFPLAIMFSIAYGISDEVHQSFVPMRSSDIFDIAADTIGSFIGPYGGDVFYKKTG